MGDDGAGEPAAAAAVAFFQTVASLRPVAAVQASRRVVLADLLTRAGPSDQRAAALFAALLADFGRVTLRLSGGEAAERGADVIRTVPGLQHAADAIHHRFERVDGNGLPDGLAADDIPFGARVVALTDLLVSQRRSAPIDWDRRIELMKDSAGTSIDVELAAAAFELLHTPGVRSVVEHATVGTALAIIEGATTAPDDGVGALAPLLESMDDPVKAAEALAEAVWSRSGFHAVGVHQVHGGMLTPIAVAGDRAERWSPLALTEGMARLTEPTTTAATGSDIVRIVPIRADELWGLAWGVTDIDDHDPEPVIGLANALRTVIDRQAERQRLDRLAHRDQLTGLANRRRLEEELDGLFGTDPHHRADAALIMCDVDGLKRVNDTRGHAAGDDVLRAVALVLDAAGNDQDALVARLGGDEFCVLLRSAGLLRAQPLARKVAAQVRTSAPAGVGLSCGVAYAAQAETPSELLRRADEAQYQVKRHRLGDREATRGPDRRRRPNR
jgi:diguanylate cyclase (GGDEF)-like protein